MYVHLFDSFEALEDRTLFSRSFASLSSHGTLSVVGTSKNNTIVVDLHGTKVRAIVDGKSLSFNKSSVKRFWIDSFRGNDTILNKTSRPSTLIGSSGNDTLFGGAGADSIEGDTGNDTISPGTGDNTLSFGAEDGDTLDYSSMSSVKLTVNGDNKGPFLSRFNGSTSERDSFAIPINPHLRVLLTAGDDRFDAEQRTRFDVYGGAGNDQFFASGAGSVNLIDAGGGDDTITMGRDVDSSGGANVVLCGAGNDTVTVNDMEGSGEFGTALLADGGRGEDEWIIPNNVLQTKDVNVPSGFEKASITAENEDLFIHGNELDNTIDAIGAHVTVDGGSGNDLIHATSMFGGELNGGPGNDTLSGDASHFDPDTVFTPHYNYDGLDGDDTFNAADGIADTLDGGDGTDTATVDNGPTISDSVSNIEKLN